MRRMAAFFAGTSVVAIIAAAWFWGQLRTGNRQIAELRQQVAELQVARSAGPIQAAIPSGSTQPLSAAAAAAAATATAPATTAAPAALAGPQPAAPMDCDAQRTRIRSMLSARSTTLVAELKLTPDEAERFLDIEAAQVALPLQCASGSPTADGESLQAQLLAVLGPARYEQMQEHNAAQSTRQNMITLRSQLVTGGEPLDAEQEKRLTATIMEENRRMRAIAGTTAPPTEPHARLAYEERALKLTEEKFERILADAQAYLQPTQIAQLKGNMTQQTGMTQENLARMRASVEAGQGIPSAGPAMMLVLPPSP